MPDPDVNKSTSLAMDGLMQGLGALADMISPSKRSSKVNQATIDSEEEKFSDAQTEVSSKQSLNTVSKYASGDENEVLPATQGRQSTRNKKPPTKFSEEDFEVPGKKKASKESKSKAKNKKQTIASVHAGKLGGGTQVVEGEKVPPIPSPTRSMSDSRDNDKTSLNQNPVTCRECGKTASRTITCSRCRRRVCCPCMDKSESYCDFIAENPNVLTVCKGCLQKSIDGLHDQYTVEQRCEQFMSRLTQRLDKLENLVKTKVDLSTLKSTVKDAVKENIAQEVEQAIKEKQLREEKKDSIIIFNVPECDFVNAEDRKAADHSKLQEIAANHLEVEIAEGDIANIVRVGSKKGDGPRPMRVKIKNKSVRNQILKKADTLKASKDRTIKKVYIVPDQTEKQREEARKLREERNRRRQEAEARGEIENIWVIRQGKLVQEPRRINQMDPHHVPDQGGEEEDE